MQLLAITAGRHLLNCKTVHLLETANQAACDEATPRGLQQQMEENSPE